ncbi:MULTISPECIES: VOC family protein [Brevibacillus]|jgi:catechol 2,3-dioxygenase-like lactoylglutathione lyase family enzyme|uniref:VOC family protein n=1 Tax=Brevibacillus TaxID=55080 RepID=UPI00203C8EA9|nr:VOC family protein [Brevibacillus borstelensis]MCM3556951.1 VOC family protein [Brevibacillus borstelensis]MED1852739.1 VOC family protein [Brevibacillus borstelensis]MED1874063.1 VOC family protein [Brevibacillus borstelensis]WNF07023.1 VOC family protein [Brevibacillus borstelensis]
MIKKIATVAVYVADQAKAREFWTEKVGFVVHRDEPMTPNASWLEVGPEGAESHLVIYPKAMMPGSEQMKASIVFECEDIDKAYQEMSQRGVIFLEEPKKMAWGSFARFKDADGNEFLLKG